MSGQQPEPLQQLLMEVQALRREVAQLRRQVDERLNARMAAFHPLSGLRFEHPDLREVQLTKLIVLQRFDDLCREEGLEYCLHGGTLLGAVRHQGYIPWDDDLDVAMTRPHYQRLRELMLRRTDCGLLERVRWDGTYIGKFYLDDPGFSLDIFVLEWCNPGSITQLLAALDERQRPLQQQLMPVIVRLMELIHAGDMWGVVMPLHAPPDEARLFAEVMGLLETHCASLRGPEVLTSGACLASLCEFVLGCRFAVPAEVFHPLHRIRFEDRDYPVPADCDYYLRRRYGSWRQLPGNAGQITHKIDLGIEYMEILRAFRSRHGGWQAGAGSDAAYRPQPHDF